MVAGTNCKSSSASKKRPLPHAAPEDFFKINLHCKTEKQSIFF